MSLRHSLFRASLLLGFAACDHLLKIDVSQSSEATVPKGTALGSLLGNMGFSDFTALDFTDAEELQNQGVQPGDISQVHMKSFDLTAAAPSGADLSFIKTMSVYVEAPNLSKVRIAHQETFPSGKTTVDFTLDDVDLVDYVVSKAMTVTTEVTGNQPDDDTTVDADFTLTVHVTSQGACNYIKSGAK